MDSHYQQSDPACWQGRVDAKPKEYIYQIVKPIDLNALPQLNEGFVILGFCSDEGVKRNLGRPGAFDGPNALRKALASLPLHHEFNLYDAGNIVCANGDLESAQKALGDAIALLLKHQLKPIVLGGGHETAWGHYQGIEKHLKKKPLKIVNFDAHFDLRDVLPDNKGSSGTPFRQIALSRQQQQLAFDYYCLGIQRNANSNSLFTTADDLNVRYILAEEIHEKGNQRCLELIDKINATSDSLYITICLDVFNASIAPGVSAPAAYGLFAEQVIPCLKQLAKNNKVISLDIVELSPKHDIDNHTAKLAANLIADFIHTVTTT